MAKIGSETKPVYVGTNGDARPCDLELHDISVDNKGDNKTIAIITIDDTSYEIKNFKQGGTAFSVTFKDYDGTVLKTEAVLKGGNATPPTSPTREGYDFQSWSGTYTNVQADQVVTATYKIKTFTVKFYNHNGTNKELVSTQTVIHGSKPTSPEVSLTGWTFSYWSCDSGDEWDEPITQDTVYTAVWIKEYNNLLLNTTTLEPSGTSSTPSTESSYHLFTLDTTANLALPVGCVISVGNAYGLLQHNGNVKTHHLSLVPGYVSSAVADSSFESNAIPTEKYTQFYDDRGTGEETSTITTVNLPMSSSKTDYSDWNNASKWGNLAPMNDYGGVDNWDTQWESPTTAFYDKWSTRNRYSGLGTTSIITNSLKLSATIDFDKTSGTGSSIRSFEYDTTCSEEVENYAIPASLNGSPVNRLCICLIKLTDGCTVAWRMHFYRLVLWLY